MPAINESGYSTAEVVEIGKWQKYLIWVILLQIVSVILFFMLSAGSKDGTGSQVTTDAPGLLLAIVRIVLGVFSIYYVYKMAKSLRKSAVIYAICMIVPLVSLFVLLGLNAKATRILQINAQLLNLLSSC